MARVAPAPQPVSAYILTQSISQKFLMIFVGLVALCVAHDIASLKPNFYSVLGVRIGASQRDIHRAFKRVALDTHPDKSSDPAATENFLRLRAAYDVLTNGKLRDAYDMYGPQFIASNYDAKRKSLDESFGSVLMYHLPYYCVSALVTFIFTIEKSRNGARPWVLGVFASLALAEMYLKTNGYRIPLFSVPLFQQIQVLKNTAAYVARGFITVASFTYIDLEVEKIKILMLLNQRLTQQEQLLKGILKTLHVRVRQSPPKQPEQAAGPAMAGPALAGQAIPTSRVGAATEQALQGMAKRQKEGINWGLVVFVGITLAQMYFK